MFRITTLGLAVVLGLGVAIAEAQEGRGRAYKVAFWYEVDRPMALKHQVYDLARGEYDEKAVRGWLDTIRSKHHDYGAFVRDVRTDGEPGATEPERLVSAIAGEERRWADL